MALQENPKETMIKSFGQYVSIGLQIFTVGTVLYSIIFIWANFQRDIRELHEWKTSVVKTYSVTESDVKALQLLVDKLSYRLASVEREAESTSKSIKELEKATQAQTLVITEQNGEWKIIREILQRVESSRGNPR